MALILLALFLEEMGFFLRNVVSSRRRHLYLWIMGMYPVWGMMSIIALYVPRSSSLCNFFASLYHSITLLKFMGLITDFFGGKARMLEVLDGQKVSPDPFPCCCCCCLPMITINRSNLAWMSAAVLQLSVVRTILFFITLVLWSDEQYDYGDVDYVNPNSYINVIIGVSTFLSFYGYLLFYKATKKALPGYGLRVKFICIIVVLFLCGLQSSILETMGALRIIPCTPPFSDLMRSQLIYHYTVIVEMFCIGVFARHAFRKVEPCPEVSVSSGASPVGRQKEKAVQTEDVWPLGGRFSVTKEDAWPGGGGAGGAWNHGYNSDSEDSLCRIEHAPLDRFPFPLHTPARTLQAPPAPASPTNPEETRNPKHSMENHSVELNTMTVIAEINCNRTSEATVV
ncbi:OSTA protein, partial [Amia calva]|nr:OSTA protein [Amia calva]